MTTMLITGNLYSPANNHAIRGRFSRWYIAMTTGRGKSNRGAKSWNRQRAFRCSYFFLNDRMLGSPSVSEQQVDYKWKHSECCSDSQYDESEWNLYRPQIDWFCYNYKYHFDLYLQWTMYIIKIAGIMKIWHNCAKYFVTIISFKKIN